MYPALLFLHSYLRWFALGAIVFVFIRSVAGLAQGSAWRGPDSMWAKAAAHLTTAQLVVGILLYAVSPYVRDLLDNMGATMQNQLARFFAVEHAVVMVLVLGLVHMGSALARKGATDRAKFTRAAIFFGLAIALLGYGIPWSRPLLRLGM